MYWWLDFHTVLKEEKHWKRFFSTFWRVPIPEEIGLDGAVIVSHAAYNHPINRMNQPWKVAYLNRLSSLSGAMRHQVQEIFGWNECRVYEESILLVRQGHIDPPEGAWARTIEKLITEILPEEIHFLNIPVSTRAQTELEKYYLGVGEILAGKGKILRTDFYTDGISYRIRD